MLLSEQTPAVGDNILAVRGHTAIHGRVTECTARRVTVALPEGRGPDNVPSFDLWVWEGWDWQPHTETPTYAFPVPMPDLSWLTLFPANQPGYRGPYKGGVA